MTMKIEQETTAVATLKRLRQLVTQAKSKVSVAKLIVADAVKDNVISDDHGYQVRLDIILDKFKGIDLQFDEDIKNAKTKAEHAEFIVGETYVNENGNTFYCTARYERDDCHYIVFNDFRVHQVIQVIDGVECVHTEDSNDVMSAMDFINKTAQCCKSSDRYVTV